MFQGYTVKFLQVNQKAGEDNNNHFLIPFLPKEQSSQFIQKIYPHFPMDQFRFERMESRYLLRLVLVSLLLTLGITALATNFIHESLIWLGLGTIPATIFSVLWYLNFSVCFNDEYIAVRSGILGRSIKVFPIHKILRVSTSVNPLLKRRHLIHLTLKLPSRIIQLPYLSEANGMALANYVTYKIESSQRKHL